MNNKILDRIPLIGPIIGAAYYGFSFYTNHKILIANAYKEEFLVEKMQSLFRVNFKVDKHARMWGVVNPKLVKDSATQQSIMILEIGQPDSGQAFIDYWVEKNVSLVRETLVYAALFDLVGLTILPVGPPTASNFLVVISPIDLDWFIKYLKRATKHLFITLGIVIPILFYFYF